MYVCMYCVYTDMYMYSYVHIYICMYIHIHLCIHSYTCMYIYGYLYYIWQRLKHIGLVTGPGGLFATRLVTESGGSCDRASLRQAY